jgi:hypothetical protein
MGSLLRRRLLGSDGLNSVMLSTNHFSQIQSTMILKGPLGFGWQSLARFVFNLVRLEIVSLYSGGLVLAFECLSEISFCIWIEY